MAYKNNLEMGETQLALSCKRMTLTKEGKLICACVMVTRINFRPFAYYVLL